MAQIEAVYLRQIVQDLRKEFPQACISRKPYSTELRQIDIGPEFSVRIGGYWTKIQPTLQLEKDAMWLVFLVHGRAPTSDELPAARLGKLIEKYRPVYERAYRYVQNRGREGLVCAPFDAVKSVDVYGVYLRGDSAAAFGPQAKFIENLDRPGAYCIQDSHGTCVRGGVDYVVDYDPDKLARYLGPEFDSNALRRAQREEYEYSQWLEGTKAVKQRPAYSDFVSDKCNGFAYCKFDVDPGPYEDVVYYG